MTAAVETVAVSGTLIGIKRRQKQQRQMHVAASKSVELAGHSR
jgi:hypothetical protein